MSLAEQVKQYKDGEILKVVDVLLPIFRSNASVYYCKRLISEELRERIEEKLMVLQNTLQNSELPNACPCVFDKILTILYTAFPTPSAASEVLVVGSVLELLMNAVLLYHNEKKLMRNLKV